MNDFESRGVNETDILNHYSKMQLDGENIINSTVNGMAVIMGSYQVVLIEAKGDRDLNAVMAGVFSMLGKSLYE